MTEAGGTADDRQRLLQTLLDSPAHGVAMFDPEGRVRVWSHGACVLTGYGADEMIGQPGSIVFTPEDRAQGLDVQEMRIAREVGEAEDERWHLRKDGLRLWTSGLMVPLRGADGGIEGYVKTFRDATHLRARTKYLENALQEHREERARRDYFLGGVAHEMRNPLMPLKLSVELLRRRMGDGEDVRRSLDVMERQVRVLERLVEDLLDLTRASTGKMHIAAKTVVLQSLLREVEATHRAVAEAAGLSLRLVLPDIPLEAEVDSGRMLQVVVNLLNNAIKFTPRGGRVWVSLTADQTHFLIFVRDTGRGIGPDLLPRVFEAFTQADGEATHRTGGVGLGLALVKEIVTSHRGTVEVRSEGEGMGTEFIVRVPLRVSGEPPRDTARDSI